MTRRNLGRRIWSWILRPLLLVAAALAAVVLVLVVWGVVEPRVVLDEELEEAPIPNLPEAWRNQRIAVIGDLQVGMWLDNEGMIRRAVARIVEERPAAALIAGDFIYHPTEDDSHAEAREELEQEEVREIEAEIERVIDLLRPLKDAGIPTYAVLGNHDYALQTKHALALPSVADSLVGRLEAIGIEVLRNEAVALPAPASSSGAGEPLYLAGIGARWAGDDHAVRTLSRVPRGAARIVMMHNPESFKAIPAHEAPLAVAGHTHGGQIRLPFLPHWSWLDIMKEDELHMDGWITEGFGAPGNRLYVNVGIGFSRVPIRINCAPELTWFTLVDG